MEKFLWLIPNNFTRSANPSPGHLTDILNVVGQSPRGICFQMAAQGWGIWQFSQIQRIINKLVLFKNGSLQNITHQKNEPQINSFSDICGST